MAYKDDESEANVVDVSETMVISNEGLKLNEEDMPRSRLQGTSPC